MTTENNNRQQEQEPMQSLNEVLNGAELKKRWTHSLGKEIKPFDSIEVLDIDGACGGYNLMFAFASACKDTLLIHASVTMHAGKGFLFLGKSGTGKSTHSQLWINNIEGCELLNDDNPALRVESEGTVRVYGTPWSGKTLCYRNLDVPVGAIVDLHQAKQNMITRLSLPKAYAVLYVSISGHRFITEMADGLHSANAKIVSTVPCYSLDCLPNAEAAWLCYKTIAQ